MLNRMIRVIRFDPTIFREIAQDPQSSWQAAGIVLIVTLLSSLGVSLATGQGQRFVVALFFNWDFGFLIGWLIAALAFYFVGTTLFRSKSNIAGVMRVTGFAVFTQIVGVLDVIPGLTPFPSMAGRFLALVWITVALRQTMQLTLGQAVATLLLGWLIILIVSAPVVAYAVVGGV